MSDIYRTSPPFLLLVCERGEMLNLSQDISQQPKAFRRCFLAELQCEHLGDERSGLKIEGRRGRSLKCRGLET